jgi:SAM-dependent methyltransferase
MLTCPPASAGVLADATPRILRMHAPVNEDAMMPATADRTKRILNLGCGRLRSDDCLNIDWDKNFGPDIVHNLNVFPYPVEANSFEEVHAFHIMEHLDRPFEVMREIHRILKPGGKLIIKTPHFSRGFTHSEHCHGFDVTFPLYFRRDFVGSGFTGIEFALDKLELHWSAFSYLLPNLGYGKIATAGIRTLNVLFTFLANLSPALCSRIWCFWVGGFEEIEYHFTCVKT